MAFVNERISEEDKVKYKIENLPDYQYRHWSSWTIDRERDYFLLFNGTSHDRPFCYYFLFSYQGQAVIIDVALKGNGQSPEGVNLTDYDICRVQISEKLRDKQGEVLQIFAEAVSKSKWGSTSKEQVTILSFGKKIQVN